MISPVGWRSGSGTPVLVQKHHIWIRNTWSWSVTPDLDPEHQTWIRNTRPGSGPPDPDPEHQIRTRNTKSGTLMLPPAAGRTPARTGRSTCLPPMRAQPRNYGTLELELELCDFFLEPPLPPQHELEPINHCAEPKPSISRKSQRHLIQKRKLCVISRNPSHS